MSPSTAQTVGEIAMAGGIILSLAVGAFTLFVTRWEHADLLRRVSRCEEWQDQRERTRGT